MTHDVVCVRDYAARRKGGKRGDGFRRVGRVSFVRDLPRASRAEMWRCSCYVSALHYSRDKNKIDKYTRGGRWTDSDCRGIRLTRVRVVARRSLYLIWPARERASREKSIIQSTVSAYESEITM